MPNPRRFHPLAAAVLIFCAQLAAGTEPAYRTGAYHGGALIVTDPMISRGHLAPGQVLPIRLSRLTPPADPALPPRRGAETPGSVRYGQLVFQQVSPAGVTFTVAFHEAGEDLGPSRTVTLHLGDSVDLTGDGLPDLALQVPVKALTVGTAAVDYALLSFPCDAAHTAMFALAPEAFAGSTYPYGISGVTAAGNFIFRSDSLAPAQATLASAAVERLIDGFWLVGAFLITASLVKGIPEKLIVLVQIVGGLLILGGNHRQASRRAKPTPLRRLGGREVHARRP